MEQTNTFGTNHAERFAEKLRSEERIKSAANPIACRNSQRRLEFANDQLQRANRDLGEVAAFIAAALTTVTAVEAVLNIAIQRLSLPVENFQMAFDGYVGLLLAILFLGSLRFVSVMRKRARAEKEIDLAKRGIYDFCDVKDWLKPKE